MPKTSQKRIFLQYLQFLKFHDCETVRIYCKLFLMIDRKLVHGFWYLKSGRGLKGGWVRGGEAAIMKYKRAILFFTQILHFLIMISFYRVNSYKMHNLQLFAVFMATSKYSMILKKIIKNEKLKFWQHYIVDIYFRRQKKRGGDNFQGKVV